MNKSFLQVGLSKGLQTIALVALVASSVNGQAAPVTQIGPGSTDSIGHGVIGTAGNKPHQMLDGALTPETRQTLQQAMNSSDSSGK